MTTVAAIVYQATPANPVPLATLKAKMAAVVLPTGPTGDIAQIASVTLASDVTTMAGVTVSRTITFTLSAEFQARFPPAGDQKAPFRNLYTAVLQNALACPVTAQEPVVA